MKKGKSKNKGSKFERLICKELSLWWTNGRREDVFTRTDSSGGRATQRSKKKKKTFGQYGDIQAADPIGQPLIDVCPIECKDGYASASIADLLDKEPRHNPIYKQFIEQAIESTIESNENSKYWMIIARRRGRQVLIYVSNKLRRDLHIRRIDFYPSALIVDENMNEIFCMSFKSFITFVKPKLFKSL